MINKVNDIIQSSYSIFGLGDLKPDDIDYILLTNPNPVPSAKTVIFAVAKPKAKGLFLIRISRSERTKPFLENAHKNLNLLSQDSRVSALKHTFPRSIFADNLIGHFVQIETFAEGQDLLSVSLRDKSHTQHLLVSKDWLIRFHNFTKEIKVLDDENIQRYFRDDIDKAKQIFSKELWLLEFLENFSQSLANLKGLKLPFVFGHYDFAPKNVKFSRDRIKVIDWEHALREGLPLIDIIHFYLRYYAKLYKKDYLDSFQSVFYQEDNISLRKGIIEYIEKIQIPKEAIFYLIVQHSILRLIKVIGYRNELLRFFRRLSSGELPLKKINLRVKF